MSAWMTRVSSFSSSRVRVVVVPRGATAGAVPAGRGGFASAGYTKFDGYSPLPVHGASEAIKDGVIAIEDARFYTRGCIDWGCRFGDPR